MCSAVAKASLSKCVILKPRLLIGFVFVDPLFYLSQTLLNRKPRQFRKMCILLRIRSLCCAIMADTRPLARPVRNVLCFAAHIAADMTYERHTVTSTISPLLMQLLALRQSRGASCSLAVAGPASR